MGEVPHVDGRQSGRDMQRATAAARTAMVGALCRAFADDPGLGWIWPDRVDRLERLPHFFEAIVGGALSHGIALISNNATAVSLWRSPGRIAPGQDEIAASFPHLARAFAGGGSRSELMSKTLKAHQPQSQWWYLQFLGVCPSRQGSGLGGSAVRAGLAIARDTGLPVYVEVMNPLNLGFYRHLGFETVAEFDIPDGGPHVWGMLNHADANPRRMDA